MARRPRSALGTGSPRRGCRRTPHVAAIEATLLGRNDDGGRAAGGPIHRMIEPGPDEKGSVTHRARSDPRRRPKWRRPPGGAKERWGASCPRAPASNGGRPVHPTPPLHRRSPRATIRDLRPVRRHRESRLSARSSDCDATGQPMVIAALSDSNGGSTTSQPPCSLATIRQEVPSPASSRSIEAHRPRTRRASTPRRESDLIHTARIPPGTRVGGHPDADDPRVGVRCPASVSAEIPILSRPSWCRQRPQRLRRRCGGATSPKIRPARSAQERLRSRELFHAELWSSSRKHRVKPSKSASRTRRRLR